MARVEMVLKGGHAQVEDRYTGYYQDRHGRTYTCNMSRKSGGPSDYPNPTNWTAPTTPQFLRGFFVPPSQYRCLRMPEGAPMFVDVDYDKWISDLNSGMAHFDQSKTDVINRQADGFEAIRLMEMADKFRLPVITLVDTPGAYPGKGAEERGQSEAIAKATEMSLKIGVPVVSVIIGEGGSGGAVAFATANRVAMLEHSIYSVISPEGCASILWKDAEKMREAAEALRLTAQDLQKLGVVDRIVKEPLGGAQRGRKEAMDAVGKAIETMLKELSSRKPDTLIKDRREKFLDMGAKGLAA